MIERQELVGGASGKPDGQGLRGGDGAGGGGNAKTRNRGEEALGESLSVLPRAAWIQTRRPGGRGSDARPKRSPRRRGSSLPRASRRPSSSGTMGASARVIAL